MQFGHRCLILADGLSQYIDIKEIKLFIEILGDKKSGDLDLHDIREYKTTLMKLPKNMRKNRLYRNKTIPEILELEIPDNDLRSKNTLLNKAIEHAVDNSKISIAEILQKQRN